MTPEGIGELPNGAKEDSPVAEDLASSSSSTDTSTDDSDTQSTDDTMSICGDLSRNRMYTLSDLEKKERMESLIAEECDVLRLLDIGPKDRRKKQKLIQEVILEHAAACNLKCTCRFSPMAQVRYVPVKQFISMKYGATDLKKAEIKYILPRNSALSREFGSILVLTRQIVLFAQSSTATPLCFFNGWLGVTFGLFLAALLERSRSEIKSALKQLIRKIPWQYILKKCLWSE